MDIKAKEKLLEKLVKFQTSHQIQMCNVDSRVNQRDEVIKTNIDLLEKEISYKQDINTYFWRKLKK